MLNRNTVALYSIFSICVFALCLYISFNNPITSDGASLFLEAKDMADGNILLRGWTLSTVSFYFTEAIWYAIVIRIFGDSIYLMYVLPSAFYTIVAVLAFALSRADGKIKWSIAALIPCVIISSPLASTMTLETCVHVGTIIFALVCLNVIKCDRYTTTKLACVSILTAASVFSDSIFNYYITIPIVFAFATHVLLERDYSKWRYVLAVIIGVVIAKILSLIANNFGLLNAPGTQPPAFVSYENIPTNLNLFIVGIIQYFDAFIFGKQLSSSNILVFGRFAVMMFWLILLVVAIRNRFKESFVDTTLSISSILLPVAYVVSNMPVDLGTTRYLVFSFITGSILIARYINSQSDHKLYSFASTIIVAFIFLPSGSYKLPNSRVQDISTFVRDNNLGDGYGTYWVASAVTLFKNGDVRPITFTEENKAVRLNWLSNKEWYGFKSRYMVTEFQHDVSKILHQFGSDATIKEIDGAYIVYYKDKRVTIQ
ncbi:hypothetical protein D7O10_10090 [Salmonella enterica subsp. enterica serovar Braenderup]|nr:hypothetical protein [Salmonella enterica subsp. enterica serovar Braenderup]ECD3088275.1 hypothetical protein [Salmonella enterica subsp. enterica serovar Braenderup]